MEIPDIKPTGVVEQGCFLYERGMGLFQVVDSIAMLSKDNLINLNHLNIEVTSFADLKRCFFHEVFHQKITVSGVTY